MDKEPDPEPPAYAPPAPPPSKEPLTPPRAPPQPTLKRSILDLRAQIIANASVMKPRLNEGRGSDDHVEVIVAKAPAAAPPLAKPNVAPTSPTHWPNEKQAVASIRRQQSGKVQSQEKVGAIAADSAFAAPHSPSPAATAGQHYAVLVRRGTSSTIKIILKGQPQDTPEEALEWMLERTEKLIHDLVVRNGKPLEETCTLM